MYLWLVSFQVVKDLVGNENLNNATFYNSIQI